jgi:uncharacterized membrane protein
MATENVILMQQARESLRDKWGLAIGTFVVYFVISGAFGGINLLSRFDPSIAFLGPIASIASIFITAPLVLGLAMFSLSLSRNEEARLEQLFDGFRIYGKSLGAYFLVGIYTFLWTLLLIVPGIIAAISYAMTFYIIADDNTIGADEAIDKSKEMMYGYKWKYFCLAFRFFGWSLLCLLTLGIGFLWLLPYMQVSFAKFYDDIKAEQAMIETAEPGPAPENMVIS